MGSGYQLILDNRKNDHPVLSLATTTTAIFSGPRAAAPKTNLTTTTTSDTTNNGEYTITTTHNNIAINKSYFRRLKRCPRTKRFLCEFLACNKTFGKKSHLKCHWRIHTQEKPFECQECGKRFLRAPCLARHERTHIGERRYVCPYCSKGFIEISDLTRHAKRHIEFNREEYNAAKRRLKGEAQFLGPVSEQHDGSSSTTSQQQSEETTTISRSKRTIFLPLLGPSGGNS